MHKKRLSQPNIMSSRSGAAYVIAVTTLLVGLALSCALLRMSSAGFKEQDSRSKKQAAKNIAEAGIDYAAYQIAGGTVWLPYSSTNSLSTGSFSVQIADDTTTQANTLLITSTGTCGKHSATIMRIVPDQSLILPYTYLLSVKSDLNVINRINSSGGFYGIRVNGDINMLSFFSNISNGVWATKSVNVWGNAPIQYPNSPSVTYPSISKAYYTSIATATPSGSQSISSLNPSLAWLHYSGGAVVVVDGDLNISGSYNGVYTFVVTGNIFISGSLTAANSSSHLALITNQQSIWIQSGAAVVQALLYAHGGEGTINMASSTTVSGSMAADHLSMGSISNTLTLTRDSTLDAAALKSLKLPGLN